MSLLSLMMTPRDGLKRPTARSHLAMIPSPQSQVREHPAQTVARGLVGC